MGDEYVNWEDNIPQDDPCGQCRQEVARLEQRIEELEKHNGHLRQYAQHRMGCDGAPCDCGLFDALAQQEESDA